MYYFVPHLVLQFMVMSFINVIFWCFSIVSLLVLYYILVLKSVFMIEKSEMGFDGVIIKSTSSKESEKFQITSR